MKRITRKIEKFKVFELRPILLLFCLGVNSLSSETKAQSFYGNHEWRLFRKEFGLAFGSSSFFGDLGGANALGRNFAYDLDLATTSLSVSASMMCYLTKRIGVRGRATFANVSGNDALTLERFRNNRNLHFKSTIYEISVVGEYHFLLENKRTTTRVIRIAGKRVTRKTLNMGMYLFGGVGAFYFNPKAKGANGDWYELYHLHTEGQGLAGGPKQYSRFSICLPMGIGIRKKVIQDWGIRIEMSHRITFTDYIDDVSTVYYDGDALEKAYGRESAYLANPDKGVLPAHVTSPGMQRGDPKEKDGYSFFQFGVYYQPMQRGTRSRMRVRRYKRSRASF